jgi:hypothetical protein
MLAGASANLGNSNYTPILPFIIANTDGQDDEEKGENYNQLVA